VQASPLGRRDVHPIKWKAKYGGLDVSEARRLKALEDENARLKKLLAESMLNEAALRDLLGKKW
jgi:putative transposase